MDELSFILFLGIHLACTFYYAFLIFTGKSRHHKEFIVIVLFIPVFGLLTALIIDIYYLSSGHNQRPVEIATLSLGEETYWKPIKNKREENNLVPLEEAITINDTKTRRKLMLESLYENPSKYIDVLLKARRNDDMETVHYASTTISKIQRDFQLEIQKLSVALEKDPHNLDLLDEYIDIIQNYIDSNILEDFLLRHQRILFDEILTRRLALGGHDKDVLLMRTNNNLALKNFQSAINDSQMLKRDYPDDERVWIEALRVCVESSDAQKLQETIKEINSTNIAWTSTGRNIVAPWLESYHQ